MDLINKALNSYSLDYHEVSCLDSFYVDSGLRFIESLIEVYKKFTGEIGAMPVSLDGQTYVRVLKNYIAFGLLFKGTDICS
ncbi:hypothetical protein [Borrelia miyamotoi]|uniref:hypothetical protein n=1 Tax=Borrelia miyamotoi TaxID=47466 RepID=UPI002180D427|nr:hypothetical protein [Borrelia miyamotoi]